MALNEADEAGEGVVDATAEAGPEIAPEAADGVESVVPNAGVRAEATEAGGDGAPEAATKSEAVADTNAEVVHVD